MGMADSNFDDSFMILKPMRYPLSFNNYLRTTTKVLCGKSTEIDKCVFPLMH